MRQLLISPTKGVPELPPEKLITVKEAADALGVPVWKLSRAAQRGLFPSYRLLNSRCLLKLSEVVAAIENSRRGGDA